MPTGYTYPVADGTITEFSKFALNCSRAFGVLMHMRDEPIDAPIPDKIEPTSYYKNQLDELVVRRRRQLVRVCKIHPEKMPPETFPER